MKHLGVFCFLIGSLGIFLHVYEARITGVWDSDGLRLIATLMILVLLEPPVAFAIRGYLAHKKAKEEREKREREEAARKQEEAERLRIRRERLAAEEETERRKSRRKAAEAWAKKQGTA